MHGTCSSRETSQKSQLLGSLSSQGRGPWFHTAKSQTQDGRDLEGYMKSGRTTHSEQHVHSCSNKCQPGEDQREDSISQHNQGPQLSRAKTGYSQL